MNVNSVVIFHLQLTWWIIIFVLFLCSSLTEASWVCSSLWHRSTTSFFLKKEPKMQEPRDERPQPNCSGPKWVLHSTVRLQIWIYVAQKLLWKEGCRWSETSLLFPKKPFSKWSIGVNFLQVAYQYKDIHILPYVFQAYVHIWVDLSAVNALIKPSEEGRTALLGNELWEYSRSTLMCAFEYLCWL